MYSVSGKLWDRTARFIWLTCLIGIAISGAAWLIAATSSHHKPVRCTEAISAIDENGNQTTIWFPKGCYHK